MYRKSPRKECAPLKQELLITQVLKFGKVRIMAINVMFGQLDAFFMNFVS
jgi:hypothetical protein